MASFRYFAAQGDAEAARALRAPLRRRWMGLKGAERSAEGTRADPATEMLPAVDGYSVDPVVQLATLEAILTDRPYGDVVQDPRWGQIVSSSDNDAQLVIPVLESLQRALADSSSTRLAAAVERWADTEEIAGSIPNEELLAFLGELTALSRSASQQGLGIYCLVTV